MFDRPIEDMREGISDNTQGTFWASYKLPPELIAFGDVDRWLEHAWRVVDNTAAQGIFEKINDGRLYCLRVERFKRNFEFIGTFQGDDSKYTTSYAAMPELSIGYKGTLSLVRTKPHWVPSTQESSFSWAYRPPRWVEIRDGMRARLRADFKPTNLMKGFVENVLARVFYLPDTNPEFWGVDDF